MTTIYTTKLLMRQGKRALVKLLIEERREFHQQTRQLRAANLKLHQIRLEFEDYRKQIEAIKKTVSRKTRSLKKTVTRRRKVNHG